MILLGGGVDAVAGLGKPLAQFGPELDPSVGDSGNLIEPRPATCSWHTLPSTQFL